MVDGRPYWPQISPIERAPLASNYLTIVSAEMEARVADLATPSPRSKVFDVLASEVALKHFDSTSPAPPSTARSKDRPSDSEGSRPVEN